MDFTFDEKKIVPSNRPRAHSVADNDKSDQAKQKRKQAFSISLKPSLSAGESITRLFKADNRSFLATEVRIMEVLLAERSDPNFEHPETKHHYQVVFNCGTTNPVFARIFLQSEEMIKSVVFESFTDIEQLNLRIWECTKSILTALDAYAYIKNQTSKLMHECDEVIEKNKEKEAIPSLPQVPDLEGKVLSFLSNGKRFVERTFSILKFFYPLNCDGAQFDKYRKRLREARPDLSEFHDFLDSHSHWIRELSHLRNSLDVNHRKSGYSTTVQNFRFMPGNKFTLPTWAVDLDCNDLKKNETEPIIESFHDFIEAMMVFFEGVLIYTLSDNWSKSFPFIVVGIPDDKIDPKLPKKYRISLDHSKLKIEDENEVK